MNQPRISRLNRNEVSESIVAIFDQSLRERGNVPYFFRTLAHRPEILQTAIAHLNAVMTTGTVPKALKELVIVRTSQLNCTEYCLASHTMLAKKLGWDDKHITALDHAPESDLFTDREKAAIHLAEVMTTRARSYSDEEFARLRSFFDEGEIVELIAAIGLFNDFNRANDLLRMEPTRPASPEELEAAGALQPA